MYSAKLKLNCLRTKERSLKNLAFSLQTACLDGAVFLFSGCWYALGFVPCLRLVLLSPPNMLQHCAVKPLS
jgi:hypothetical protein